VGNNDHENISLGKAGRKRWLGKKPHNRGVVMNPVDHPMGGGEGKSSGGRHPCTPWGIPTKVTKHGKIRVRINILLREGVKAWHVRSKKVHILKKGCLPGSEKWKPRVARMLSRLGRGVQP